AKFSKAAVTVNTARPVNTAHPKTTMSAAKPRFIQTFLDKQLDGLPTHKEKYDVSFHTKKVFANMKRIGNGFSGKETSLFPTMVGPNQVQMGEGSAQPTDTQHTPTFDMPPSKPKKIQKPRQPKRKTTKATSNEPSFQGTSSSDGARRQDTMGGTSAHTRYERVSKMSIDSPLAGVNTRQNDKDRLKHIELMKICTALQKKVLDLKDELKRTKAAQQTKINGLERRVKKLEKKHRSRTHKLKRLYKVGLTTRVIRSSDDEALDKEDTSKHGRIDEIDANEDIALVCIHDDVSTQDNIVQDEGIKDVGEKEVVEVVTISNIIIDVVVDAAQVTTAIADIPVSAAETIVTIAPTITVESTKINVEVTQASKRKRVMIQEPEETTTTKIASSQQPQVQDKGKRKAKLIEEPVKLKKKD
nr:hypothetical protein [Tanacetum cinerariifolium]